MGNNKKYCIWCGNEINGDAKYCTKCGKVPYPNENLFKDWLMRHTKDYLKDKSESSLVSALKNWALSNLYGLVMSITIITTAVTVIAADDPQNHIEQVDAQPPAVVEILKEDTTPVEYEFTMEDADSIDQFMYDYEQYLLENRDNLSGWPEDFWLTPAMSGDAQHQFYNYFNNNIYYPKEHIEDMFNYPLGYTLEPVSEIGRSLKAQGFKTVVTERCLYMYIKDEYQDNYDPESLEAAGQAYITFTLVHINGNWRIAEEFVSLEF